MYGEETAERQYSEKQFTQREPEYDEDTDRYRRKSTQVKWGGRDARREPDSGVGYTQDWHSQRWTTDRDRGTKGRQMDDRIPGITGISGDPAAKGTRRNLIENSTVRYLKQLCVRMVGMM